AAASKELRGDGRAGDAHQQDVVEPDRIEAVVEGEHALDLVGLDHRGDDVAHRRGGRPVRTGRLRGRLPPRDPVRNGEDGGEIVRRMPPFGREPCVVEVEPAYGGADVERGGDGIELVTRARHAGTAGDLRTGH